MIRDGANNLDMTYNSSNLLKNVEQGGAILAKYSYLADGRKLTATESAGNELCYLGSLVYRTQNGTFDLESASFGGGRLVVSSEGLETRYFLTDHLGSTRVVAKVTPTGREDLDRKDYYPFGKEWAQPDMPTSDNRYTFSGKEKQHLRFQEIDYADFGARFYDADTGIFLQQDPSAEDYYHIGQHVYCAGNPVSRIDSNGCDFTIALRALIQQLMFDIYTTIANNEAAIADFEKRGKGDSRRAERLRENNAELEAAILEITAMEFSDQLYDVKLNAGTPEGGDEEMEYYGWTTYNHENKAVTINLAGDYDAKTMLHELKHGFQFEDQTYSFASHGLGGGQYYDFEDEVEAHKRGSAIDGSSGKVDKEDYRNILHRGQAGKIDQQRIGKKDIWHKNVNPLIKLFGL